MRELSTKALARMRAAGVEVDSVALASAEEKVSIRMPSPAPAPATAVASKKYDMSDVNTAEKNAAVAKIAKQQLRIPTLETRNNDSLDFYSLSVWSIKAALEAAFVAGLESNFNDATAASSHAVATTAPGKRIAITYETWDEDALEAGDTDNRGWEDEEGVLFEDEDDKSAVQQAIEYLRNEGATQFSSDPFEPRGWYSTDGNDFNSQNIRTGEHTVRSFHLNSDWTDEEKLAIYNGVIKGKMPDTEDVYHTIASCIEDVAAFARVSASNRVQQSLVIASSCVDSSISDMAYKFAAAEALAAYNATPDHAVKVPVGAETLAAVASALQGEAIAAGLGGMTNAAWVNWKKVAATKGITLEDGDRTLIDAAVAGVNSRKANSSAAGLSMDTVFARMQLPAFTNAKTFGQKVDVLQYGA